MSIEARLKELGIELPPGGTVAGNYVPYLKTGNLLFISGQLPLQAGKVAITGIVGRDVTLEVARDAARLCAINILAQAKAGLGGDLEKIRRVVKLTAFIASTPEFTQQPDVANGASDLLVEVLGDRGRHTRSAVGAPSLPRNGAVEIDAIIEVD
jgi:enamine deaminase RidA (YjgF/YER057c/UK114 family)